MRIPARPPTSAGVPGRSPLSERVVLERASPAAPDRGEAGHRGAGVVVSKPAGGASEAHI